MSKRKLLNQEVLDKHGRLNELLVKIRNAIDEIDGEINKLALENLELSNLENSTQINIKKERIDKEMEQFQNFSSNEDCVSKTDFDYDNDCDNDTVDYGDDCDLKSLLGYDWQALSEDPNFDFDTLIQGAFLNQAGNSLDPI